MRNTFALIIAATVVAGCGQQKAATPAAATPVKAAVPAAAVAAPSPSSPSSLTGKVLETLNGGGYTYLGLATASGEEWAAITRRYPEGSVVLGTVTEVLPGSREYTVKFDDCWSAVEYDDVEPVVGWTNAFRVTRLLEWTHRILLKPAR